MTAAQEDCAMNTETWLLCLFVKIKEELLVKSHLRSKMLLRSNMNQGSSDKPHSLLSLSCVLVLFRV